MDPCLSCISTSVSSPDEEFFTKIRCSVVAENSLGTYIVSLSTREDSTSEVQEGSKRAYPFYISVHRLGGDLKCLHSMKQYESQQCAHMSQMYLMDTERGAKNWILAVVGFQSSQGIHHRDTTIVQFFSLSVKHTQQIGIENVGRARFPGPIKFAPVCTIDGANRLCALYQKQNDCSIYFSVAHLNRALQTQIELLTTPRLSISVSSIQVELESFTPVAYLHQHKGKEVELIHSYVATHTYLTVGIATQQRQLTLVTYYIASSQTEVVSTRRHRYIDFLRNVNQMLVCTGTDSNLRAGCMQLLNRKTLQLLYCIDVGLLQHSRVQSYMTSDFKLLRIAHKGYVIHQDLNIGDQSVKIKLRSSLQSDCFILMHGHLVLIGNLDDLYAIRTDQATECNMQEEEEEGKRTYMAM